MLGKWKKEISLLLVVAMLAGMVCIPGVLPTVTAVELQPENLLANPGFETRDRIPGWNTSPNPVEFAELSSDYVKDGSYAMQVSGTGKWLWSDKMTGITAGTAYVMSADVLADPNVDGAAVVQGYIRFYDDSDTELLRTPAVTLDLTDGKGAWQTITVNASAPQGAAKADVLLVTTGDSVGTVFFDNVSFMKKPPVTEPVTVYSENFDAMESMNVTSSSAAVAGSWYSGNRNGVTYTVDDTVKSGTTGASLKFDKTASDGTRTIQISIQHPVQTGKSYRAELMYKGTVANQFYLQSYGTVTSQRKESVNIAGANIVKDGSWNKQTLTLTATQDANYLMIVIGLGGTTTGTVYFDEITVTELPVENEDPSVVFGDNFDDLTITNGAPDKWSVVLSGGVPTATYAKAQGKDGSALQVTKEVTGTSGSYYISRDWSNITLEEGKTYRLEVDFKGNITNHYMLLRNDSAVHGTGTIVKNLTLGAANTDTWTHYQYEFTVDASNANASLYRIALDVRNNWAGTVAYDNLRLVDVAAEEAGKEPEGNRLANNSFDTYVPVSGWSNPAGSDVANLSLQSAELVRTGSYAMKLVDNNTAGGVQWISESHAVTPGDEYEASAYVRGGGYVQLALRWLKADGKQASQILQGVTAAADTWQKITATGVAPEDATHVCVLIVTTGASTGTAYFDDTSLVEKVTQPDPSETTESTQGSTEGTQDSTESTENQGGSDNEEALDPTWILGDTFNKNVVDNDNKLVNWQDAIGDSTTTYAEVAGEYGSAMQITKAASTGTSYYIQRDWYDLTLEAGKTYRLSVRYKGDLPSFYLTYYIESAGNRFTSNSQWANVRNAASEDWKTAYLDIIPEKESDKIRVIFDLRKANAGTIAFDNVCLVELVEDTSDGNLLTNPSFENGADAPGWTGVPATNVTLSTEKKHSGSNSMKIADTSDGAGYVVTSDAVAITAGKEYTASVWVYDEAGDHAPQIYIRYRNAAGTQVLYKGQTSQKTVANEWTEISYTLQAPDDAATAEIVLATGKAAVFTAYFDDVSLKQVEENQGGGSGGDTPGGGENPLPEGTILDETFDNTAIDSEKKLPKGWLGAVDANVTYSLDTTIRKGDAGAALKMHKVDGTTTTRTIYYEKTFNVTPGKLYRVELDYYGDVECQFYLQTFNGSKQIDSQNAGAKGVAGQWTHLVNEFVVTEAATKIRVTIGLGGSICGTVYFDNIKLIETDKPVEEEVVDPSILVQDKFNDTVIGANGLPSGWTGNTQGGVLHMKDGNVYLEMTKADGTTKTRTIYYEKNMEIKAGQKFRVEMDYYGGSECQFYLQLFQHDGSWKSVQSQNAGKQGKENAWVHLTNEFVAQEDADRIRVTIGLGGSITGTVGFDNIRLVEVTENGEVEIYTQDFENAALQASTIPKGWYGALEADTRFKLKDTGSYLEITKDKATEEAPSFTLEVPLDLKATETYKAQIDFLGKARAAIQIELLKNGQVVQATRKSAMGDSKLWSAVAASITAEHDADAVRITVSLDSAAIGVFGFDNLKLCHVPKLDLENMVTELQNPSFELPTTESTPFPGWYNYNSNTAFSISDEQASDGKYSLKIVDEDEDGGMNITSSRVEVVPNAAYVATVDVYGNVHAQLFVRFLNKYGNVLADTSAFATKEDGFWYTLKVETTAPADAAYVVILLATSRATIGRVYFDNVTIKMTESDSTEGGSVSMVPPKTGWQLAETEHPRLYFTTETFADIAAFAADDTKNVFGYSGKQKYQSLIKDAERFLTEKTLKINYLETVVEYDMVNFPDPNEMEALQKVPQGYSGKSYPYMSAYTLELKERMQYLSMAYMLTGDTRYADRAIEIALKVCEWEIWGEKTHSLGSLGKNSCQELQYTLIGTATVYDMLYDLLTEEQRKTIKNAIVTKGLDMLMEDTETLFNHNYYLLRIDALITGACAIAESAEEVEEYLTRGYNYAMWYLDNLYASGDQEGFMYNHHQLEYLVAALDNMTRVTGNSDLISHKYFSELLVDWILYFMAPGNGKLMPISDSPYATYYFNTLSILNKEQDNEKAGFILKYGKMSGDAFNSLLYTSKNPVIADANEIFKAVVHIEELGYGGLRSGWDADDIFLSIVANNSDMHHNHYDQNSIIFATDGNILVADAGYADTSGGAAGVFGRYHGHSTIFVDGEPQQDKGKGTLSTIVNSNLYGYLMGSAPGAYGVDKNGQILSQFDRHAIMINHGDRPYYVIFDELASSVDRTYTWNMFTGDWNALEVEGKPMEVGQTVKGNKVAVSTSGGMLFAEFVGKKPLEITAVRYEGGGPNLQVNSELGKVTQFMTILTKSFGDNANEEFSFVSLLDDKDAVEYKTSSKNPEVTKSVSVQSALLYFFRGEEPGDYITFPFEVKESGNFELILKTACHYNYGTYKIYVDGKYITTYDACAIKSEIVYLSLGQMDITAGKHTLKMELVGTSSLVGGTLISASSVILSSGQSLGSSPIYTQEVYDTDQVLGAKIFHSAYNSDIALLNRGTGSFTAGGVTTDAKQATIIGLMEDGYMEGFSASNATSLAFKGKTLVKATNPVTVAADFRGKASYEVTTGTDQVVKLYAGDGILGATVDGKTVDFTKDSGMAAISLTAGTHTVVLKMSRSTIHEYLEDGTVIITTYDQNGKIVRQHTKNPDGTELLTENGKVILRIYIDEDTLLFVKEELAEDGTFTTTYYDVVKNVSRIEITHPDGSITKIDYQSDGTIVTTKFDKNGNNLEGIIQYPDGSVTKAEYKSDCTVTTKTDKDGNVQSITTQYKDGRREEIVYNADGTVVTTTYAKGGKLASVHTKNADGTAVLVEYLEGGAICTTKYDADGKIVEKITVFKDGSYIKDGFVPKLIEGEGQTYDGTAGLVFVSDDDIVNFKYVTVNGEEIDPAYYIVEAGSIKVTLPIELLSILPNGTYTVGIVSTHGTVTANFHIGIPETGVSMWLWIGIAAAVVAIAGGTVAAVVIVKNKKKKEAAVTE